MRLRLRWQTVDRILSHFPIKPHLQILFSENVPLLLLQLICHLLTDKLMHFHYLNERYHLLREYTFSFILYFRLQQILLGVTQVPSCWFGLTNTIIQQSKVIPTAYLLGLIIKECCHSFCGASAGTFVSTTSACTQHCDKNPE
jgi:hypothetical protein